MPLHTLKERTYLDADGQATTDEKKAVSLLGIKGDEILAEDAHRAGLLKDMPKSEEAKAAEPVYYDSQNRVVPAGDPMAVRMYLDDDPTRPDSPEREAHAEAQTAAEAVAPSESAMAKPDYERLTKAELVGLMESRRVKADGFKKADIIAALEAADQG